MKTNLSLNANQEFTMSLASRVLRPGLAQFAWAYVIAQSGFARITIIDTNGEQQPEEELLSPGIFASVVRESSPPNKSVVKVIAGNSGFRGELQFEILEVR